jgi:cell division septation protein DedD
MEQPLQARLIGASILVLLAVALVPELLSGPKDSAAGATKAGGAKSTRTVTIDLGGAVAEGAKLEPRPDTAPAATPAAAPGLPTVDSPAPVAAAQTASTPKSQPAAIEDAAPQPAREPEARPVAIEPAVQPAAPAKGAFSVQVGAFGSEATARKLVNDLKVEGMPAYVAPLSKSGKTLHRVRVGPVADRAAADKLAVRLKARGLPVSVVSGG